MAVSFPLQEVSGTPIHARTIARLLAEKGDQVFVLATENRRSPRVIRETLDNFPIYRLPLWLSPLLSLLILARERPQVVSVQAQGALASVFLPARLLGLPLVYEVHGLFRDEMAWANGGRPSWRARFYDLAERLALPQVRRVIVLSEKVRQVYVQELKVPAPRVEMIYPAVDFARFQKVKELPGVRRLKAWVRGRRVVMYAGSLYPAQGIDLLVEAIPLVLARVPQTVFVFVGDEPKVEYMKLLEKTAPWREHRGGAQLPASRRYTQLPGRGRRAGHSPAGCPPEPGQSPQNVRIHGRGQARGGHRCGGLPPGVLGPRGGPGDPLPRPGPGGRAGGSPGKPNLKPATGRERQGSSQAPL